MVSFRKKVKCGKAVSKAHLAFLSAVICLCICMLPKASIRSAAAASTEMNLQVVTNGAAPDIQGAQLDRVYFGTYPQSSNGEGGFNIDPIRWNVLENADGQLFLMSIQCLDAQRYEMTDKTPVSWENCTLRSWLNSTDDGFLSSAYSAVESGCIAETEVEDNITDKVFILSYEEVINEDFGFISHPRAYDPNREFLTNTSAAYVSNKTHEYEWWLRTTTNDRKALYVQLGGNVDNTGHLVNSLYCVRPAFKLNLSSVILASAAEGGKVSNNVGAGALTQIQLFGGSEWKFTVHDSSRDNFSVSRVGNGGVLPGETINFSYSDAKTGTNEFVSALLFDSSNNLISYGRIVDLTASSALASGNASVTVPADLTVGSTYTLKFISEQCNGDKMTDYSSNITDGNSITFTVKPNPASSDFVVTLPANTVYDGNPKTVSAAVKSTVIGMGTVTVKYYDEDDNLLSGAPVNAGTYKVKLDVAEGTGYYSATGITDASWTFTITGNSNAGNDDADNNNNNDNNNDDDDNTNTNTGVAHCLMYRLYNPNSGEHFYTGSDEELDNLKAAGWTHEGNGFEVPVLSDTPVYRMYNPNAGDHHYTNSAEEKENLENAGWNYEGVAWYSAPIDCNPLYRLNNPNASSGAHHYTMSEEERDNLINAGWNLEGIGWFGY